MVRPKPETGVVGLPPGVKEQGQRVDFRPTQFDLLIETKQYRMAWSRALPCPCVGVNDQTDQPDPNCHLCNGGGWFYFKPDTTKEIDETVIGALDPLQRSIVDKYKSLVIGAYFSGLKREDMPYSMVGDFPTGDAMVTVRSPNKLAFRDRLIALDVTTPFHERIPLESPLPVLPTRYPVAGVNLLVSVGKEYCQGDDFEVDEEGQVVWLITPPSAGEVVSIHYIHHPAYIVISHPHINRTSIVKAKNPNPRTPRGDPVELPVQAMVRYEWLVESPRQ